MNLTELNNCNSCLLAPPVFKRAATGKKKFYALRVISIENQDCYSIEITLYESYGDAIEAMEEEFEYNYLDEGPPPVKKEGLRVITRPNSELEIKIIEVSDVF